MISQEQYAKIQDTFADLQRGINALRFIIEDTYKPVVKAKEEPKVGK